MKHRASAHRSDFQTSFRGITNDLIVARRIGHADVCFLPRYHGGRY
jgi:hypothetical protein